MARSLLTIVFGIFFLQGYYSVSTPQSDSYVAAVVEYYPTPNNYVGNGNASEQQTILDTRTIDYITQIQHPDAADADIIVFPQSSLNDDLPDRYQRIPDPLAQTIPCGNDLFVDSSAIQHISCAARNANKYVVINLVLLSTTTNRLYNGNVVFDRSGAVISEYGGTILNLSNDEIQPQPQPTTFNTDFGVQFGHLISTDLIELQPANDLLLPERNIKNFILTSKWISMTPYLMGVQMQQSWAYKNSINLLAAGYNGPSNGYTGSGIYSGRLGALRSVVSGAGERNNSILLVSRIAKQPGTTTVTSGTIQQQSPILLETDNLLLRHENINENDYNMMFTFGVTISTEIMQLTHCDDGFCCQFEYRLSDSGATANEIEYSYVGAMFNGKTNNDGDFGDGNIRVCAVLACTNLNGQRRCGTTYPMVTNDRYNFVHLSVKGSFINTNLSMAVPTTLTKSLVPLETQHFIYTEHQPYDIEGVPHRNLSLLLQNPTTHRILTFGFYARQDMSLIPEPEPPNLSETYVAAVVEYRPEIQPGLSAQEILQNRVIDYITQIQHIDAEEADIIVFPHSTLNNNELPEILPNPDDRIIPCNDPTYENSTAVQFISCSARNYQKYVVINVITEQHPGHFVNANVVFDRNGTVISVYHESNIYSQENGIISSETPEIKTFNTDFGVEFGHLMSLDLISLQPATNLLENGIFNYVLPCEWVTMIPFLSGVQAQQAWAYKNRVNLLAAGMNDPSAGKTGSGIYSGRYGGISSVMSAGVANKTIMLVNRLPKIPGQMQSSLIGQYTPLAINSTYIQLQNENLNDFYKFFMSQHSNDNEDSTGFVENCDGRFCCSWEYSLFDNGAETVDTNSGSYFYAGAMYTGNRYANNFADGQIRVCTVLACTDGNNLKSCGTTFPAGLPISNRFTFNELSVTGTFFNTDKSIAVPTTLTTNLLPLNANEILFDYTDSFDINGDEHRNLTLRLNGTTSITDDNSILTFGLYARQSSASSIIYSWIIITFMASMVLINISL